MSYGIILGGNQSYSEKILKSKWGWSELLQIQDLETHIGKC
jgi:hypothetical protein